MNLGSTHPRPFQIRVLRALALRYNYDPDLAVYTQRFEVPMVRWIAFDDDTADALVGRFKRGAAEIRDGNVLDSALHHDRANILIYPSTSPERVLLARVSVASADVAEPIRPLPVQPIRPASATPEAKKSWWRRHIA